MKNNLKNRPQHDSNEDKYTPGERAIIAEYDAWFSGLESEIRSTLVWLDTWRPRTPDNIATKKMWTNMLLSLLGERGVE